MIAQLLLLIAILFGAQSTAQEAEDVEYGAGVLCDTAAQMKQFIDLTYEEVAPPHAIAEINRAARGNVCISVQVMFIRGPVVDTILTPMRRIEIVEITVVGAQGDEPGWVPIKPMKQFIATATPEIGI